MNRHTADHPRCRFCGTRELDYLSGDAPYDGVAYSVRYCRSCAIGMTWPQPDSDTLEHLYAPGEYRAEEGKRFIAPVEWLFEWQKQRAIARLAGGQISGRMADIGCGSGYTAALFARNGWEACGVEFSDETAIHARETYGLDVVTSISKLQGLFDLILINHVLEHTFDPEQLLRECRALLAPRGRLVVAVPNISSFQARFGRKSWFHRDLPIHLFHFSEAGLATLLAACGYAVIERSHADWPQNFYGWLQTLLNRTGLQHNALYDFLRRKDTNGGLATAAAVSLLLCAVAVPAALLGMLVERLFQTGGVIRFTAVANQTDPEERMSNRA